MEKLSPEHQRVINLAKVLLQAEKLPEQLQTVVERAQAGDAFMYGMVEQFVKDWAVGHPGQLSQLIATYDQVSARSTRLFSEPPPALPLEASDAAAKEPSAGEPKAGRSSILPPMQIPYTPGELYEMAKTEAENIRQPMREHPDDVFALVFSGIESAEQVTLPEAGDPTIRQKVSRIIVRHGVKEMLSALRPKRGEIIIQEAPRSNDDSLFLEHMSARMSMSWERLDAWSKTELWNQLLTGLFTAFLVEGRAEGNWVSHKEQLEETIRLKRDWYEALEARGMHVQDVERAFRGLYEGNREKRRLKVIAELSRFDQTSRDYLQGDELSMRLLVNNILDLHGHEPELSADDFLRLLVPYLGHMTRANIESALRRENPLISDHERFVVSNILSWHLASTEELASRLRSTLEAGRGRYKSLQEFLREVYGFQSGVKSIRNAPPPFVAKLVSLRDDGVEIEPITTLVHELFPGILPDELPASPQVSEPEGERVQEPAAMPSREEEERRLHSHAASFVAAGVAASAVNTVMGQPLSSNPSLDEAQKPLHPHAGLFAAAGVASSWVNAMGPKSSTGGTEAVHPGFGSLPYAQQLPLPFPGLMVVSNQINLIKV